MNRGAPENGTSRAFLVAVLDGSEASDLGVVRSAREANDLLASVADDATSDRWLILSPNGQGSEADSIVPISSALRSAIADSVTNTALIVEPAAGQGVTGSDGAGTPSVRALATWIRRDISGSSSASDQTTTGSTIALRPDRVIAVGGFDSAAVGLGFADLVTQLRQHDWTVVGAPTDPLALQDLEPQLTLQDRLRSTAEWHRRHGRSGDFNRYRRQVIGAVGLTRAQLRARQELPAERADVLHAILADAKQGWPGPRPDEEQQGVGRRADWRFLLPDRPAKHLLLTGSVAHHSATEPHFLAADGWADHVSVGVADRDAQHPPDVVVIGLDASVQDALANTAPVCTVAMELDRNPLGRLRRVKSLRGAGFDQAAQYLVTPDLDRAKRYVSLDQAEAIGWLLAPPPPVKGTPRGARRAVHRLLIKSISRAVATAASLPVVSAIAGTGTQGLIVATRGVTAEPPSVLMTSGHDEGSRAVLVSLGGDGSDRTVTKMSPRPRYNQNAEAEAEVIRSVLSMIDEADLDAEAARAAALVPTIRPPVAAGGLRGAQETYAGRWTATDLCNRVPASREPVLVEVLAAIDDFSLATVSTTEPWSDRLFDRFLGDLFNQYHEVVGDSPALARLRTALEQRSAELLGTPLPLVQRHYDLGPWNVVFSDDGSGLTIIDWELAPPRMLGQAGLGGADQLYFAKYWLHIALETGSVDEELLAFTFLGGAPQASAARALEDSLSRLGVDRRFVPLLTVHLWLETALYTATRRAEHGGDPGSAARYLEALAARRSELMQFWS